MVQKDKLAKVTGRQNEGVSAQQKENAKKAGAELAATLGIDEPIEELQAKK